MKKDLPIDRYLMKVTAFSKDIKILLHCANLPCIFLWFRSKLTIKVIVPSKALNFSLPNSADDWKKVVNSALESINKAKEQACVELYKEIPSKIMSDTPKIINKLCNYQICIHCDCTLLAHIYTKQN